MAIQETSIADLTSGNPEDAHLALLKVLSLEESGQEDEAARELENLTKASCSDGCPVTTATLARRKAESQLEIFAENANDLNSVAPSSVALKLIWEAMDYRLEVMRKRTCPVAKKQKIELFLARFTEIGVPISPSWMTDTIDLCHLAAGYPSEAALFFKKCIGTDPVYSPAYLHLGDCYIFRHSLLFPDATPRKSDIWHAKVCYHAVQMVEVNKNSRTRRLADLRLGLLKDL